MKNIKITQVKSRIKIPEVQKRTLDALGMRKLNQTREFAASPQVLGMIDKVKHLLIVEEIN